jgi:hypothetical protein
VARSRRIADLLVVLFLICPDLTFRELGEDTPVDQGGEVMGSWCSKENTPGGRQPHDHNHNHNHNSSAASKGGKNRYANFGDDYHTLEQVSSISSLQCLNLCCFLVLAMLPSAGTFRSCGLIRFCWMVLCWCQIKRLLHLSSCLHTYYYKLDYWEAKEVYSIIWLDR